MMFNIKDWIFEYVTHYPGYRNIKTRVWIFKAKFDRMVRENAERNKGLLNKEVSIWSELNGKSLRILNGNLMESNAMKDGYLVVNGENTLSFSGNQVSKIDKTNLYLKFIYKG